MKKKTAEKIVKAIPDIFKSAISYVKDSFDQNAKSWAESAPGTVGIIVKLFAQPLIDQYYEKQKEKKMEDFGLRTYLKAGLIQAEKSLDEIKDHLDNEFSPDKIFLILNGTLKEQISEFDTSDVILIFQPKYHPVILFVKNTCVKILKEMNIKPAEIKRFQKHFNENIERQIKEEFGEDYEKHLTETKEFRLKENEVEFLWDMKEIGRIGLRESENLKYEQTYAEWKKISDLREKETEKGDDTAEREKNLRPVEELIEEYFGKEPENHLENILFIVADFGKGKSVFLRHYTSKLAKEYFATAEGYFPIYFNLRNFKNYSGEPKLGVVSDYLESKYSIKIDDGYFKKKKYIFLIDSLDESGELNKGAIDRVIESVKSIQGIDKTTYKTNRIIISSRPFEEGLVYHLKSHKPPCLKNKEGRDIPLFISLYGFKKEQFNRWMTETIRTYDGFDKMQVSGFAGKIIESVKTEKQIDIYEELVNSKTLSRSELRRPIFAYMVYQLILKNIDFASLGKIGVYLSFINLLTKDAKHIHDPNYSVNLEEEFEFRNILHATAALWMYERQQGNQGALKKADICRVLEAVNAGETDTQILERYKDQGVLEIEFLSHSYFGENDNILHFQHQSFAEILLAEYYLKVFIKYALDKKRDIEQARLRLVLGEPTEQTIRFFKEMLQLLRDSAIDEVSDEVLEKRRLLTPLMASLATEKHNNNLFSNEIFYQWYHDREIPDNVSEFPITYLKKWCINQEHIEEIIDLAKDILESKTTYILTKADPKTSLYDKEVLSVQSNKLDKLPPDIDRWLALTLGNVLFNNEKEEKFFNSKIKTFEYLFDLIRNWNYAFNSSGPIWGTSLFRGLDMRENETEIDLSNLDIEGYDFSNSYLKNLEAEHSKLDDCTFSNVEFEDCNFAMSSITNAIFTPIKLIKGYFGIELTSTVGIITPYQLSEKLNRGKIGMHTTLGGKFCTLGYWHEFTSDFVNWIFETLEGFFIYGLKHQLFDLKEIKTWFKFDSKETEELFIQKIDALGKYEFEKKDQNI